jgi:hypothetical protein
MITLLESAPVTSDPIGIVLQYGVLGVVLIMLLTGQLWPKPAVDELKRQCAEDLARHKEEEDKWTRDIVPLLQNTSRLLQTNTNEITELSDLLREGKKA